MNKVIKKILEHMGMQSSEDFPEGMFIQEEPDMGVTVESSGLSVYLEAQTPETLTRYLAAIFGVDDRTHGGWVLCLANKKKMPVMGEWPEDIASLRFEQNDFIWVPRTVAEVTPEAPQIIPYCFVIDPEGNTLVYERAGVEKRLTGKTSIGWGGHISLYEDSGGGIKELIQSCIYRELNEELSMDDPDSMNIMPLYGWYQDDTELNAVHLCVAYIVSYLKPLKVHRNDESKNILKVPVRELMQDADGDISRFEAWSQVMLKYLRKNVFPKSLEKEFNTEEK